MKTEGEGINVMGDVVYITVYGPKRLFWIILLVVVFFWIPKQGNVVITVAQRYKAIQRMGTYQGKGNLYSLYLWVLALYRLWRSFRVLCANLQRTTTTLCSLFLFVRVRDPCQHTKGKVGTVSGKHQSSILNQFPSTVKFCSFPLKNMHWCSFWCTVSTSKVNLCDNSAKVLVLVHNLHERREGGRGASWNHTEISLVLVTFMSWRKSVNSFTMGECSGSSSSSARSAAITESSANLMMWCFIIWLWHKFVYKMNKRAVRIHSKRGGQWREGEH